MLTIRRVTWMLATFMIFSVLCSMAGHGRQSGSKPGLEGQKKVTVELDEFFQKQLREFGLAAIGACIVKDEKIAWSGGFGLADIENKRPATPGTIFAVGSVSKVVTLAAFMRLWERGKCALDDDVSRYLPYPLRHPRFPGKPITIRTLLSFTAGIFDVDMKAGQNRLSFLEETRDPTISAAEALKEFLVPGGRNYSEDNFLATAPGERYAYSNSSYSLIGHLVERLSGRPFWEFCRQEIFAPLGMDDSSWRLVDLRRDRYAYGYLREAGRMKKKEPTIWPGYMDGGLRTTAKDFGHFLAMMIGQGTYAGMRVLKPQTVDAMLALQNPPGAPAGREFPILGRGFVWILSQVSDRRIFQMNGFGPAFFAQVYFDPERKTGGAFFTTGEYASFAALGTAVTRILTTMIDATARM